MEEPVFPEGGAAAPRSSRVAWAVAAVTLAGLAALTAWEQTNDPDFFWHLAVGREALATKSSLPRDVFSFSTEGRRWLAKDLVADALLFLGFTRFGFAWVAAFKAATGLAIAAACHLAVPGAARRPVVPVACGGAILASFWLVERPPLFSMALLALTLALLERARRAASAAAPGPGAARAAARAVGPVAAVTFAWTSLHTFAIVGHALLLAHALELAAATRASGPRARALLGGPPPRGWTRVVLVLALATPAAATLLNPNGTDVWSGVRAVAGNRELRDRILEWKQLPPGELVAAFPTAAGLVGVALAAASFTLARAVLRGQPDAPARAWHVGVVGGLAALALESVRWLPYAAIAAGVLLAPVLAGGAARLGARARRAVDAPWAVGLAGLACAGLVRYRQEGAPLALGEDPAWSPRGAVAFAAGRGLSGRVANSMELGGYLLWSSWPRVRVLVDGRAQQVHDIAFYLRCLEAEHDASAFLAMRAEDGATWALVVNRAGEEHAWFLARDPAWALVYWSDTAAIYARRDAHPDLAEQAYRFVAPEDVAGSVDRALAESRGAPAWVRAIEGEVRRMVEASPDSVRANLALALLLTRLGPARRAERDRTIARLERVARGAPEVLAFVRALAAR